MYAKTHPVFGKQLRNVAISLTVERDWDQQSPPDEAPFTESPVKSNTQQIKNISPHTQQGGTSLFGQILRKFPRLLARTY